MTIGGKGCGEVTFEQKQTRLYIKFSNLESESRGRGRHSIHCRIAIPIKIPQHQFPTKFEENFAYFVHNEGNKAESRIHVNARASFAGAELGSQRTQKRTHPGSLVQNSMLLQESPVRTTCEQTPSTLYILDITLSTKSQSSNEKANISFHKPAVIDVSFESCPSNISKSL